MRRKVAPRPRFGVTNLPSCANRAFHIIRESGGEFWDMIGRDPSSVSKSNSFAFLWKGIELKAYYSPQTSKMMGNFPERHRQLTRHSEQTRIGIGKVKRVSVCLSSLSVCLHRQWTEEIRGEG